MPFRYVCDECRAECEAERLCSTCSTDRETVLKLASLRLSKVNRMSRPPWDSWSQDEDQDEDEDDDLIYTICLNCCPGHQKQETP